MKAEFYTIRNISSGRHISLDSRDVIRTTQNIDEMMTLDLQVLENVLQSLPDKENWKICKWTMEW